MEEKYFPSAANTNLQGRISNIPSNIFDNIERSMVYWRQRWTFKQLSSWAVLHKIHPKPAANKLISFSGWAATAGFWWQRTLRSRHQPVIRSSSHIWLGSVILCEFVRFVVFSCHDIQNPTCSLGGKISFVYEDPATSATICLVYVQVIPAVILITAKCFERQLF